MKTLSMGWRERIAGSVAAVLLYAGTLLAGVAVVADAATPTLSVAATLRDMTSSTGQANSAPTTDELAREKLGEEIRQLQLANNQAEGWLAGFLPFAPFVTVLLAIGSLAAALWKQSKDVAAARDEAAADAARWREDFALQQKTEAAKNEQWRQEFLRQQECDRTAAEQKEQTRFDDTLSRIAAQISSDNLGLSLNGAATLGLFVKPRYRELHLDLLRIIIANLKAAPNREVADLLRYDLAKVLNMIFAEGPQNPDLPNGLELANLNLYRLDLHGIKFPESIILDCAFSNLEKANFSETIMIRARGFGAKLDGARFSRTNMTEARFNRVRAIEKSVHFHETRLVSATFDDAELPYAEFQQAKLQGAKFRRCDLRGARFEGADVNDAYFQNATLDEVALCSIARGAHNWSSAHFDSVHFERIKEIAKS